MSMDDAQHLDDTIEMLLDIRDVYREFEEAREAFYGSGKDPETEPRWVAAKQAMQDKRAYWKGIRDYVKATSVTAEPETARLHMGAAAATAKEG